MPIAGIDQPEILAVDKMLRLRRYDGRHDFALPWYRDAETVWLVDGKRELYDADRLTRMYRFLDNAGELYFIEVLETGTWRPVGDVTFSRDDMPIVIGERSLRGHGIGRRVVLRLTERARELGYTELRVSEIYDYNAASVGLFRSMGFVPYEKTAHGHRYRLAPV